MPTTRSKAMGEGWSVGVRVWLEQAGQTILGSSQRELLEEIDRCHSISAAARQLGISYRRAWELVQSVNETAGEPLVVAATGGPRGGGAELTPLGRWAVATFGGINEQIGKTAAAILPEFFQRPDSPVLHVAAAVSLQEVLNQLLIDYALLQPQMSVRTVFGASDELADRIIAGDSADLVLTADAATLDRLEKAKLIEPKSRTILAGNSLAAIGLAEEKTLPTTLRQLIRQPTLRIALAHRDCPLGAYTRAYLDDQTFVDRAVLVDNSRAVVSAIQAGQADVGLVYASDAARVAGCRLLFRIDNSSHAIQYHAALINRRQDLKPPRHLLEFLTSSAASPRFRSCGFTAIPRTRQT